MAMFIRVPLNQLACHIPPNIPDGLIGDPGRLRQIVFNLMGNAIKFTEGGVIVVDVALETRPPSEIPRRRGAVGGTVPPHHLCCNCPASFML